MTNMMLNTADPITPLTPMSSLAKKTPMITVPSSGAELPKIIQNVRKCLVRCYNWTCLK